MGCVPALARSKFAMRSGSVAGSIPASFAILANSASTSGGSSECSFRRSAAVDA